MFHMKTMFVLVVKIVTKNTENDMSSTIARSIKILKSEGFHCGITEKYNSFVKIKNDLFGFADLVAFKKDLKNIVLAINATTNSNLSNHIKKYSENKILKDWIECGHRFEIWCWSKMGKMGKRKLWTLKRVVWPIQERIND